MAIPNKTAASGGEFSLDRLVAYLQGAISKLRENDLLVSVHLTLRTFGRAKHESDQLTNNVFPI